jgi:hypothetical protein
VAGFEICSGPFSDQERNTIWPHCIEKCTSELPGNTMPAYRIYTVGDDGNFSNAPEFVVCADDKEAIEKATQITNGRAIEIWEHDRLVAQLPLRPPKV